MIRLEQSMSFLVPAASLVPLGIIYVFGPSATGFGWAIFGALLLVMVERTVTKRIDSHFTAFKDILQRTALVADSVDAQHIADKNRMDRLEGEINQIRDRVVAIDDRCATAHDR